MPIRNGDGSAVLLGGTGSDDIGSRSPSGEMVETTSSPRLLAPRPKAPALSFPSPPPEPAKSAESKEHDDVPADDVKREDVPRAQVKRDDVQRDEAKPEEVKPDEVHRDDISVPPVGLDGGFFDEPISAESSLEIDIIARDLRAAMKLTPTAARRRAHLARYVTAAVGLATALCAAALVKITVARGHEGLQLHSGSASQAVAAASPPALNPVATTEAAQSPPTAVISAPADHAPTAAGTAAADPGLAAAPAAVPAQAAAEPGAAAQLAVAPSVPARPETAQAAAPPAEEAAGAPSETAPASDVAPLDPKVVVKEAASEKAKSRGALEWGKVVDAIAAGERSVQLDPTDAEAWLILGAAYQQKGDSKNAVRSFRSCVDQGKRGPKYDCAAMLH